MAIDPFLDRQIDEEKLWEFIYETLPPGIEAVVRGQVKM
jgi:hypothetical protein